MDWTFKVILCRVIYLYSTVFKIEKSKHKILKPRQMNINVGICVFFNFFLFFVESFFCCFFFSKSYWLTVLSLLANIRPSLNADFHLMRDKGRFGKSQGRLLLCSFYFSTFRSGPSPFPASGWLTAASFCTAGNLTFRNRLPQHVISIFFTGAASTLHSLADAVLPFTVPGSASAAALGNIRDASVGFEVPVAGGRADQFQGLTLLERSILQVLEGE